ncbi:High-affinity gluconate transporter [Rubripirellula tenax]|uniref:High-affinity gluconate transporter n=1 Tax=Rubripirellula tenax TaxID=2528015 RepID=A0A5C6EMQ3_9BACT|nr:SLC13 family permease [Rubripirellula tenax]TWU48921.1 High-affinity gluconate transporter [Rubripirellula tenax]
MAFHLLATVAEDATLASTVFTAVSAIAILLVLILWAKVHAFVALILASYYVGLMSGMDLLTINDSIKSGMGGILGFVATVVGLGAIFGKLLEASGGAEALAYTLLKRFGEKNATWAMVITGFLVSIPVFLDVALVIIIPIVYALTRKTGKPVLYYGIPLLAGLGVTHTFVPPTPGPIMVAEQLGANMGLVILYGVLIGFPTAVLAGPVFGSFVSKNITKGIPEEFSIEHLAKKFADEDLPSFTRVFMVLLLPIVLILIQAVASEVYKPAKTMVVVSSSATQQSAASIDQPRLSVIESGDGYQIELIDHVGGNLAVHTSTLSEDKAADVLALGALVNSVDPDDALSPAEREQILQASLKLTGFSESIPKQSLPLKLISFVGHPFTALIIAIFAASWFLARKQGFSREQIMELSNSALAPAGIIILVTGAGGVFKQILIDSNVATVMAEAIVQSNINIFVLAFLIAALVRIAQGSATVAMVTTAAIIAPLLPEMSGLSSSDYALLTIAIASGSTVLSHVNDSGFWLVSKFFGLTEKETLMSWTIVETIIGICGFIGALSLSYIL